MDSGQTPGSQHENTSHHNQPTFYNQPHYLGATQKEPEGQNPNIYLKVLIDENSQLKKELREMTEMVSKFRKGIGSKKRQILNELMNLISTKNTFEERYVSEVTTCPYRVGHTNDSRISNNIN